MLLTFLLQNDIFMEHGELSERFMELVLKTSDGVKPTVSSNLTLSATITAGLYQPAVFALIQYGIYNRCPEEIEKLYDTLF